MEILFDVKKQAPLYTNSRVRKVSGKDGQRRGFGEQAVRVEEILINWKT